MAVTCHRVFNVSSCSSHVILSLTCRRVLQMSSCPSHTILYRIREPVRCDTGMQDRIPDPVPSCPSHVIVSSCQCPSRVLHVSSCQCPSHVIVSFRCHRVLHIPVWLLDFTRHYILRVFNMPSCPSHVIVSFTCHRGNQSPCHSHVHQPAKPFQGGGTSLRGGVQLTNRHG